MLSWGFKSRENRRLSKGILSQGPFVFVYVVVAMEMCWFPCCLGAQWCLLEISRAEQFAADGTDGLD